MRWTPGSSTPATGTSDAANDPAAGNPRCSAAPASRRTNGTAGGGGGEALRYWFWVIAAAVVAADQATKAQVQAHLPLNGPSTPVIPGVLWLTYVLNPGVAFGQLSGGGPLLIGIAAVAAAGIIVYRARLLRRGERLHPLLLLGLALPLGGAVGNMIDRLRVGRVIDFLDLGWFPVFNVADCGITVGAVCLAAYFLLVHRDTPEPAPAPLEPGAEQSA